MANRKATRLNVGPRWKLSLDTVFLQPGFNRPLQSNSTLLV